MEGQEQFRQAIAKRFAELKAKQSDYSLRKFAKDLGQNPAALSQILSGKRNVSRKFALRIAKQAGLDLETIRRIETGFVPPADSVSSLGHKRWQLPLDEFEVVANWRYFAILSLAETQDFRGDASWIANRLGIAVRETEQALARLERLGLLKRGDDGQLMHAGVAVCTSDEIASLALKKRHEENLESARAALYRNDLKQRDFSFVTMAIDPAKIDEAKRMIRRFQNELCSLLESGDKTEVYEICVQLFPRSTLNDALLGDSQ